MTSEAYLVVAGDLWPQPEIVKRCTRCGVTEDEAKGGYVVVSPSGCAHHGTNHGETCCGHDATGPRWWWPV